MLKKKFIALLLFLLTGLSSIAYGQTSEGGIKPSVIAGDAVSVGDKNLVVSGKSGPITVILTDKTQVKRVSATNPDFKAATAAAVSDISIGDKLTVTGVLAADGKSIPARAIYLMTKGDIAQKNAKETEEWRTRGITGKVVSVNPQTSQLTVEMRSLTGSSNVTLTPKQGTKFLRYAPDSVRFDEAKNSAFDEIKPGDMVRALGDRSSDGTSFAAEKVISGAFQTVAGTVKFVDAAKNEVVIKNLQTGKDVTIVISGTSTMKRFPAEMAERMAGFSGGGVRPVGQGRPATPVSDGQGRAGFGGQRGGTVDDMLDRFPSITAADLKPGDMIAISSTRSANLERMNAIKLLAGVEPFLRMAEATGAGGRRGGQGVDGSFNIPGLDGVSFP